MLGDNRASRARAVASIERLDAIAFATVVGGLALVPANLHSAHRLEVAANMVLAGRARGRGDVTRTRARTVVGELIGDWTGHNDDPWSNLATEALVYHGGTHLFIPGGEDTIFILRALARAVEGCGEEHGAFKQRATRVIQFACAVSDDVLRSVGAGRNQRVPPPAPLDVPPDAALRRLRSAVLLDPERFEALRRRGGTSRDDVERFCVAVGTVSEPEASQSFKVLSVRPLVRCGETVVVIAPHLIAEAAIRNVLILSNEAGATGELARVFHRTAWFAVDESLRLLGIARSGDPLQPTDPTPGMLISHTVYQCDRDKLHHVMLVSDALVGAPLGAWDLSGIGQELLRAQRNFEASLGDTAPPITAWNSIVTVAGMGRNFEASFDEPQKPCWAATPAALETIAHAEEADALLLWKHMESLIVARVSTTIVSFSPFDTYAHWKMCGRRFDEGIEAAPNMIMIAPGTAETLRFEAASKRDWRALPSWRDGCVVEVALAEGPWRGIYMPRERDPRLLALAVETPGPLIWVLGSAPAEDCGGANGQRMCAEVVRMTAFWLSEFAGALTSQVAEMRSSPPVLVEVDLLPSAASDARTYKVERLTDNRIHVTVDTGFCHAYDATNLLERDFAVEIVAAALGTAGLDRSRELAAGVLESVAPLGVKRVLHAVRTDRHPSFCALHELPSPRYVSDHDLRSAKVVAIGNTGKRTKLRLEGDAAHVWLNAAVGRLYADLRQQLAMLDPHDALSVLLRCHEALVHEDDERDLTFASVLACAERSAERQLELQQHLGRHALAAVATRFLVEHVVAEEPTGDAIVSVAAYDRLLALGAEIIRLGTASDAIKFGLAGTAAFIEVGACDYIVDLAGFESALDQGRGEVFRERFELEAARTRVPGIAELEDSSVSDSRALSSGVEAEFGCDLHGLSELFGALIALAHERGTAVVQEPREALLARLVSVLGPRSEDVATVVSHFFLRPRVSYLSAPATFQSSDIHPWRFNRGLSFLRRPLILRSDDVVWFTPGSVSQAARNLVGLIFSGRFKASTARLRASMDAFTQAPSRSFVDDVARVLKARGLVVRSHVKKIGGRRIEKAPGQDAGDIDVLVADLANRRIVAIECKDFQQDRMPHEIQADLVTLFVGGSDKASAQALHQVRVQWLRTHRDDVISAVGGACAADWTVDAAIVTSRPLVSPHLGKALMPVWTVGQLRRGEGP